jgi:uridine kinase
VFVGIAGGTASGKTSLARALASQVGSAHTALLELDSYYHDLEHLALEERQKANFDHPDSFDWELLARHLEDLAVGRAIDVPVYDYIDHTRTGSPRRVLPRPLVLIEGILLFWNPRILEMLDIKVFVDTPADLRLMRRIRRDTKERHRSLESILEQYRQSVRPMHAEFCEPTKVHADVIIPNGARNRVAVDMVRARLQNLLESHESA